MVKKSFNQQNNHKLSKDPPDYMGRLAKSAWRKVVPFLEATVDVERIDTPLVEMYCTQYEIYREAYKDIVENGQSTKVFKTVITPLGENLGKEFVGYKRNPTTQVYSDALKNLVKIGSEMGLSPKARGIMQEMLKDQGQNEETTSAQIFKILGGGKA